LRRKTTRTARGIRGSFKEREAAFLVNASWFVSDVKQPGGRRLRPKESFKGEGKKKRMRRGDLLLLEELSVTNEGLRKSWGGET